MNTIKAIKTAGLTSVAIALLTPSISMAEVDQTSATQGSHNLVHRVSHSLADAKSYTRSGKAGYKWGGVLCSRKSAVKGTFRQCEGFVATAEAISNAGDEGTVSAGRVDADESIAEHGVDDEEDKYNSWLSVVDNASWTNVDAEENGKKDIVDEQKVSSYSYDADMLTKDENIVSVSVAVQYRIQNARNYLFVLITCFPN